MKNVVLIVLNNFKNDSRVLKEAISLKNAGYGVKVAALHEEPLAEFDEVGGVSVHRIKLKSRGWSKNKIIQILKYFEYIYKFVKLYRNNDIFHCNDLNTLPIGVIIKLFFNKKTKIVYDAHEFETEIYGISGSEKIAMRFLENFLIRFVDVCFTVSDSIADEYKRMYPVPPKPTVLFNAPHFREFKKTDKFREVLSIKKDSIILLYQGILPKNRGLEIFLDTFKQRKDDKMVMIFLGNGELSKEIKEATKTSNNIFYHSFVSPNILLEYTSSADIGVSYIQNVNLNENYCMPNKLFEFTMAGLPILSSNIKDQGETVRKYNLGVIAKDDTPEAINSAIEELLSMDLDKLRQNALQFAKEYCWEEQEKKMIKEYKKLEF